MARQMDELAAPHQPAVGHEPASQKRARLIGRRPVDGHRPPDDRAAGAAGGAERQARRAGSLPVLGLDGLEDGALHGSRARPTAELLAG